MGDERLLKSGNFKENRPTGIVLFFLFYVWFTFVMLLGVIAAAATLPFKDVNIPIAPFAVMSVYAALCMIGIFQLKVWGRALVLLTALLTMMASVFGIYYFIRSKQPEHALPLLGPLFLAAVTMFYFTRTDIVAKFGERSADPSPITSSRPPEAENP